MAQWQLLDFWKGPAQRETETEGEPSKPRMCSGGCVGNSGPQLRSWSLQELSQRTPSTLGFHGPQHNSQRAWPLPRAAASEPGTPREPPRLLCSPVPRHFSFFPECHSSYGLAPTHSSILGLMTSSPTCTPGQSGFWSSPTPTPTPARLFSVSERCHMNYNGMLTYLLPSSVLEPFESGTTRFYSSWGCQKLTQSLAHSRCFGTARLQRDFPCLSVTWLHSYFLPKCLFNT